MRRRPALLACSAATAALFAGLVATPAHAASPVVLDHGHVDAVDVEYEDGALELHVHDESVEPSVEYDPREVVLKALPGARTTVPADASYRFLGPAGAPVSILPQTQDPDLLWPGFSTEELATGVFAGDSLEVALKSVRGPGTASVFTTGPFGAATVLLDSSDGLPDALTLPAGLHEHVGWGFTKPGVYQLTFQVSAKLTTGAKVSSAPAVLTFCID
ncbi:choice-of-anchor M domain-containing protein [Amycolatopsis sp. A133]|uniref:choice-of-anchor M domain-containing protein n=1 Tax=Amycolatopsis sp. A133 TaxID=3064472 RepID=UPI0027E8E978|nr:choice-of-anchor M domain-containing protein [Amycolatopsis sp. A133]MDQ7810929.1 choice-of-anchor M domain-containing protein [Amycolatopsis sp. A133]